jgi:dsDNA-binding SOS-regulon protein
MEYQDLIYFGYDSEPESKMYETDFIKEIKEKFPNVELKDAYDSIKGYRREVYLDKPESDNYWAWLIAFGWLEFSLKGQLMLMDEEQKEKLLNYINLAKSQYPNNFKN